MFIDFLIGLFAANALPHYLFSRFDSRILGLFGYSSRANLAYSIFCMIVSLSLFQWKYGLSTIAEHGILLGVLVVVFSFYVGWGVIDRFLTDHSPRPSDSAE
ncbi:hypothetical protein OAF42_03150 [Planctomicrobium sp.]|jgi:hypothetical protein|nr:hypothetical protein [Planctomicrobium sp.]MBT5018793.1 hypothetical protein [Planctomicrobium sp.]MDA7503485.1 hypothetical protein [bacterium]MDB4733421.1 hypothetical protein [Planctomicrobium sp.]